jgi:hypothetical protein
MTLVKLPARGPQPNPVPQRIMPSGRCCGHCLVPVDFGLRVVQLPRAADDHDRMRRFRHPFEPAGTLHRFGGVPARQ